ncbi:glycosyltransferase [Georgenia alba]|uniref:D-inositol 3-phosphate glycosyltransferase n=1 Tax=Georgenia alba TaxID=2233858 RepID=A0ABW2QC60_9MICO
MKILIGADTYAPDINGSARFAERLAVGLAGRGHEVHVACASDDGKPRAELVGGCVVHRLPSVRYHRHASLRVCLPWQARGPIRGLVEGLRPDVVHVQSHLVVGRELVDAARRHRLPLVATNHFMPENVLGYVPLLPRWLFGPAGRVAWRDLARVFRHADLVTAPTPRAVRLLEEATGLTGEAVSCGVDADRFWRATCAAPATSAPHLLFVGRLDPEKRIGELIRAFAQVRAEPAPVLEIVGDGDQRAELERLAADLDVDRRVRFHGHVSDEELLSAYGRAAVFCMPSIAELQSIATLEAMAAGKPVLAADAMALPHLVRPDENGWLFPPGDVDRLAGYLQDLLEDDARRAAMGHRSRELVARHAVEATLAQFEALYASLAPAAAPARPRAALVAARGPDRQVATTRSR